jgi:hypothetical protein
VDAGPAKVRRRFTAVPEDVTIQMILSEAEMATLKDFIVNTLLYVLPFTWVDFRTNVAANYRLKNGQLPSEEHYGDDMWMVSLDLELLP